MTRLRPLLANGTFGPNLIATISAICDDWFRDEWSLVSFVFRSIFHDLIVRGWDDPQGIPTPEFNRFVADVLPCLNADLMVLPGDPMRVLQTLVVAYHDFI